MRGVLWQYSEPFSFVKHVQPQCRELMSRSDKLIFGFAFGTLAVLIVVFATYWFGIRDTWEPDNHANIIDRCDAVLAAVQESDDDKAAQAYLELTELIGERSIENENLTRKIDSVEKAIVQVNFRYAQAEQKRKATELAERRRRQAKDVANRRNAAQFDRDSHSSVGRVDYSLVQTLKDSWRKEGWRHKSKTEQAKAVTLMVLIVHTDIEDTADRKATVDYIQRTISTW